MFKGPSHGLIMSVPLLDNVVTCLDVNMCTPIF